MDKISFSVFTKPWKTMSLLRLAEFVSGMGFDGIELPVRPGYQVEPEDVAELPQAARLLGEYGVKILSVAGPTDEATIAACAEAGVPTIRIMAPVASGETYLDAEARYRREFDALVPLLDRYGVQVGVQNHFGRFVTNAVGLRRLVEPYDRASHRHRLGCRTRVAQRQRARAGAGRGVVASVHGQPEERFLAAHQRPRGRGRRVAGLLDGGAPRAGLVATGGGGAASERLRRRGLPDSGVHR